MNALNLFAPKALAMNAETLNMLWQTPLLGMGMVFAVLAILWGILCIFKIVFARPEPKKKAEPVSAPKAEAVVVPEPVAEQTDDTELIAILTAAIVAYESSCGNEVAPSGFRVVSLRRTNGGKAWNSK